MARSTLIKLLGVVAVAVVIILDLILHGHFDDGTMRDSITEAVSTESEAPSLANFQVKVNDRTAYVSGLVDTPVERHRITEAALRAPGILTLVNDFRVDLLLEELFKKLQDLMAADGTPGEFSYRVHDDGHTVTLHGWVPEGMEDLREAIEQMAWKVPGVRRVINAITVGAPGGEIEQMILNILRAKNIYFDYDKATIREDSLVSIEKIAGVLKGYPAARVRIEGHTDSIASDRYNQGLSERRAESVRAKLVEYGVEASRFETVGFGESKPIAPNNTPEGRADNRRIEFRINPADFAEPAPTTAQGNR